MTGVDCCYSPTLPAVYAILTATCNERPCRYMCARQREHGTSKGYRHFSTTTSTRYESLTEIRSKVDRPHFPYYAVWSDEQSAALCHRGDHSSCTHNAPSSITTRADTTCSSTFASRAALLLLPPFLSPLPSTLSPAPCHSRHPAPDPRADRCSPCAVYCCAVRLACVVQRTM